MTERFFRLRPPLLLFALLLLVFSNPFFLSLSLACFRWLCAYYRGHGACDKIR